MKNENSNILLLEEEQGPIIIEEECKDIKPIIKDFIECYIENKDKPIEEWLSQKLQEQLPDRKVEEIKAMTKDIVTTIEVDNTNKESLSKSIKNGRSKESWFASEIKKATSAMSAKETIEYLNNLDNAVKAANESLWHTIITQKGVVSQNPRLDGFIAEQYHAQTFNMNAEAAGSSYRAKVLEPSGNSYAKNSVDIVIVDDSGKSVRRYQSKYCKNAKATEQAFEHGDYRGQQKLVPEGQEIEIKKKSTTVIEAPDGTTSNPFTKSRAEQMRDEAQSGNWNKLNWNEYATKDLAIGIGKQAGYAALQGAAIGVGLDVAQKLLNDEKIETEKVIETAFKSGADFGIKAAIAGALKVGVEKEIITVIPKGTPASTIANIAYVAIENARVVGNVITGELSFKEGIDKIEQTTVSTVAGLAMMSKGGAIGATIGTVLGPVGTAIGGFVGGTVGYMAGSKVGETVIKGAQKVRSSVMNFISDIKSVGNTIEGGIKSACRKIKNFLGF